MIEYRILRNDSASNLEIDVQMHLAIGWKLHGGVSVSMIVWSREQKDSYQRQTESLYAQAMTKE